MGDFPHRSGLACHTHFPEYEMPLPGFVPVAPETEFTGGQGRGFSIPVEGEASPIPIAVFCLEGTYRAIRNQCPHQFEPLHTGTCTGKMVACAHHGWQFDLETGEYGIAPGLYMDRYEVVCEAGTVYVNPTPLPKPVRRETGTFKAAGRNVAGDALSDDAKPAS